LAALKKIRWKDLDRYDVIAMAEGSGIRRMINRSMPGSMLSVT
jgi:hypothetical protein